MVRSALCAVAAIQQFSRNRISLSVIKTTVLLLGRSLVWDFPLISQPIWLISNILIFLPDASIAPGARSEVQECALSVGLLMFGIILERFIHMIQDASTKPATTNDNGPKTSNEALLQAIATKQNVIAENLQELAKSAPSTSSVQNNVASSASSSSHGKDTGLRCEMSGLI